MAAQAQESTTNCSDVIFPLAQKGLGFLQTPVDKYCLYLKIIPEGWRSNLMRLGTDGEY